MSSLFQFYLSLPDVERALFDQLWHEHQAQLALPELPLLVWEHIVEELSFRDKLSVRGERCERKAFFAELKWVFFFSSHLQATESACAGDDEWTYRRTHWAI